MFQASPNRVRVVIYNTDSIHQRHHKHDSPMISNSATTNTVKISNYAITEPASIERADVD
jgi:hypothetical protein